MAFSTNFVSYEIFAENAVSWNLGELCPKEYF